MYKLLLGLVLIIGINFQSLAQCELLTGVEKIVCLVDEFKSTLTATQLSTVEIDFTDANAAKWSNLPGGVNIRNGLEYSELSAIQLAAALAVIEAASGTTPGEGYEEFNAIRAADEHLGNQGGGGGGGPGGGLYSDDKYIIAFLGTPNLTDKWMLQFGGHHYAQNVTFNNGQIISVTPSHQGVEPLSFTLNGVDYDPMTDDHAGMYAMLASFSSSELALAEISTVFSDVLLGPNQDGLFPATKLGIKCSDLTAAQKQLVLNAIKPWVNDAEDEAAAAILSIYEDELDDTYIAFSGSHTLNSNADYVRIDGPSVWIELVCQDGVVFSEIHYHSVFRDHTRDYGEADPLVLGVQENFGVVPHNLILGKANPNPFVNTIEIPFTVNNAGDVTIVVYDSKGVKVTTLLAESLFEGDYNTTFTTEQNGIYFYIIEVCTKDGCSSETRKIVKL